MQSIFYYYCFFVLALYYCNSLHGFTGPYLSKGSMYGQVETVLNPSREINPEKQHTVSLFTSLIPLDLKIMFPHKSLLGFSEFGIFLITKPSPLSNLKITIMYTTVTLSSQR